MKTLLFIAADSREFAGLLRHSRALEALDWPVDYSRKMEHDGNNWFLVANGPGPALASGAALVATRRTAVDAIVSTGFCGGLDPVLAPCEVFVADRVVASDTGESHPALRPRLCPSVPAGSIVCGDRVIQTVEEKQQIRLETGASAVDMESSAVQSAALEAGVPFYCVRVVTDTAREGFSTDFNSARNRDGRFSLRKIVFSALRHPCARVPELFRLQRRSRQAADALGDFLADCKF
ncbi:MAG: hypothetical protein JJE04_06840 [Acidobacteriia bacterium]|nr:hypothetical protein [Terriglobia bacterium]